MFNPLNLVFGFFEGVRLLWMFTDDDIRYRFEKQRLVCEYCPGCEWPGELCRRHQWDVDYLIRTGEMNPIYTEVSIDNPSEAE